MNDSKKTNDPISSEITDYFNFEGYLDLTISQILTLTLLSTFPEGSIRFTILKILNEFFSPTKKISASSFYNSLKKLQKKKLLEFKKDDLGRDVILVTEEASTALNQIGYINNFSNLNLVNWINSVSVEILLKLSLNTSVESVLVISHDIFTLDLHLYPFIENNAEHIHTLANDDDFNRFIRPYSEDIHQTIVFNKLIREPNNVFAFTFLPSYNRVDDFHGLNTKELLSEIKRVTKPGGRVVLLGFLKPEKTDHFMIDSQVELFYNNPFVTFISKEEVQEDMTTLGLKKMDISVIKGLIVGIGDMS